MRTRSRVLLTTLTAALVLGALASGAGARRFALNAQTFRIVWSGAKLIGTAVSSFELVCPLTLEGSFHSRTLSKVCGQLIGYVTRAIIKHPCTSGGGEAFVLNGTEVQEGRTLATSLPWHVRYNSFAGTLPRILRIHTQVIGAAFLIGISLSRCLYRSTAAEPMIIEYEVNAGGGIPQARFNEMFLLPLQETQSGICGATLKFSEFGPVTQLGSTAALTVALVQ